MTSQGRRHHELINSKIRDYISRVHPGKKGWEGTLETLKSFIFEVLEEDDRDIQMKIRFFEKSIDELKGRFSSDMSRSQEIHMDIWMGQSFEKFGAWDKVVTSYEKAIELCQDGQFDSQQSESLRSKGHIHMMRSQWKKALDAYKESLQICQASGNREGEALAYNSMGIVYFEQGKLDAAQEQWEKGIEIADKLNNRKLSAQLSNNLGALNSMQGDWEHALAYYGKSTTMFEMIGEDRGLAETYHNMGMTYADAKDHSNAATYYEKSYEIAKDMGDVRLQALVKLNRVELYTSINDTYAGLALCNQALQTFVQLKDSLGEAETYKFMGILYGRAREWDLASSFFDDCIMLAGKHKNPLLEGEAYFEYGQMHRSNEEKDAALERMNKALAIFEELHAEKDAEKVKAVLSEMAE